MSGDKIKDGKFEATTNGTCGNLNCQNVGNEENVPPPASHSKCNVASEETMSPRSKTAPRFEAFMMTGDLIINLDKESSGCGIIPPSLRKIDSLKASSTPSSPGNRVCKPKDDDPGNAVFTSVVRTSKSEDHLQKAMLSTVNIDIEDNGLASSSSINNLMDPRAESDRIVWTYNDPKSSPEGDSSTSTPSPCSSCTTSPTSQTENLFSAAVQVLHEDQSASLRTNDECFAKQVDASEVLVSFGSRSTKVDVDSNKVCIHVKDKSSKKHRKYHKSRTKDGSPTPDSEETSDDHPYQKLNNEETSVSSNGSSSNGGQSPSGQTDEEVSDIDSLHSYHYSPKAVDMPSAYRLAKRLYMLDGFKKSDVSRHLSKK